MRVIRTLLLALAAAIVVLIVVIATLPHALDWNRYRGSFELLAGDALGRPVTIAGPITLSLLPEPVLTASKVEVGGSSALRMTLPELRLRVALLPLLSGEVDARSLTLKKPTLRLAWPPRPGFAWNAPPWLGTLSAEIDDGTITIGGFTFTGINATIEAGRGEDALVLAGSGTGVGGTWQANLSLGKVEPDGTQPLHATLAGSGAAAGTHAKFDGVLASGGRIRGHVLLASANLGRLLSAPALPLQANAELTLVSGHAGLSQLSVTLGRASAEGGGVLTLAPTPRLDLALVSTGNIPLTPWLEALRGGGRSLLPIGLSLSSPSAELARGRLRNVTLAMVLDSSGARIGAFRAILPGEARLSLDGRIDREPAKEGGWKFLGDAHLAAPRLATTLRWLDALGPAILPPFPDGTVDEVNLSARVSANAGQVALDDVKGTIEGSHVSGGVRFGLGGRRAISAGLRFDTLDLDPWMRAAPRSLAGLPALLKEGPIQLRLAVQNATLEGQKIDGLSLDAAMTPDHLIIRRLDATSDGTHAIASGTIAASGAVTAGSLALTASNPALLARLLPKPLGPSLARWPAALSIAMHAVGPPKAIRLEIDATLGDLRFTGAPIFDIPAGTWQGALTLRYPDAMKFVAASGLAERTKWLGPGSLSLIAHVASAAKTLTVKDFRLVAGALALSGTLAIVPGAPRVGIDGVLHADTLPLPFALADAAEPLPFALLSRWHGTVGFTLGSALAAGRVLLHDVSGRIGDSGTVTDIRLKGHPPGGGALTLALTLHGDAKPPSTTLDAAFHDVTLRGGLSHAALDLRDGTLEGTIAAHARGYGLAAMLATLAGTFHLHATDGTLSGLSLSGVQAALTASSRQDAARRLAAALSGGTSHFDALSLKATASRGQFIVDSATMHDSGGQMTALGSFDPLTSSLDVTCRVQAKTAGAPPVTLRLAGSATKPERLTDTSAALAWLAARKIAPGGPIEGTRASSP